MFANTGAAEDKNVKMVAYTIILFISSLFAPFVIVASIQSMFFYEREYWFFETPASAYLIFMAGMFLAAIVMSAYLILNWKWEHKRLPWILAGGLVLCIPLLAAGIDHYYYANEKGVYLNEAAGVGTKEYEWTKFTAVKKVYVKSNQGQVSLDNYTFTTESGEKVVLRNSNKFYDAKPRIDEIIEGQGLKVSDNFHNPIMEKQ
ncbi:hypothetical protein AM500_11135 [Bacillus sp. FJAT-18017]|uniref:hypothetical protein n=1 Tax=Bacillus sp. FJAT-18017 TaxID=1705566 RepID=UPI0006AE5223|nr:hypothetical protein [Bacillus sp. FJAT-18017]ALC90274.1 hypothetical protein AM500_11135 [Bacillus sp. FJAT-18017]